MAYDSAFEPINEVDRQLRFVITRLEWGRLHPVMRDLFYARLGEMHLHEKVLGMNVTKAGITARQTFNEVLRDLAPHFGVVAEVDSLCRSFWLDARALVPA